ncbi:hypothetical protein GCM10009745_41040 [Kribbella yunnanensis]|uniref:Ankyrin repeat domain-containing protein n=1 Tax=Kribbella yunnanensis TaxID=190194 RepID=A0ABP4TPA3_9ACTN
MTTKKPISKTGLLALIKELDWRSIEPALQENPDLLGFRGKKGESLLHVCCGVDIGKKGLRAADSVKTADVLIDASLDVNEAAFTEGDWEATPLYYAISRGQNPTLAEHLLKRGASPEHCLWAAAYKDHAAVVRLLLQAGATVDALAHGETPFLFAVKWSRFAAAAVLIEAGTNINFQDKTGRTALHYMLKKRSDAKYVELLLRNSARLDLADQDGVTAGRMLSRLRDSAYQKLAQQYG